MTKEEFMQMLKDPDVRDEIREMKSERGSREVLDFKEKMKDWIEEKSDGTINGRSAVRSGLYGVLRLKLGLKSMNSLSDEQLDQAYEVFEEYKQLVSA